MFLPSGHLHSYAIYCYSSAHDLLHLILAAESVGVDIRVNQRQDVEYLFAQVARHLTRVQEQGLGKPGLENLKAFT